MANQKQRITGTTTQATVGGQAAGAPADNLPRQNVDRENAVVGAQGGGKLYYIRYSICYISYLTYILLIM